MTTVPRRRYTLDELLVGMTPENRHPDPWFDGGMPYGREFGGPECPYSAAGELLTYPLTLTRHPDCVLVAFPDLPEAHTFGWDEAGALEAAADCLREALRARVRDGETIPAPSPISPGGHAATALRPTEYCPPPAG